MKREKWASGGQAGEKTSFTVIHVYLFNSIYFKNKSAHKKRMFTAALFK